MKLKKSSKSVVIKSKPARKLCTFNISALQSQNKRVKMLENQIIQNSIKLGRIYKKKCPNTVVDWETYVLPKLLTLVGKGLQIAASKEKR